MLITDAKNEISQPILLLTVHILHIDKCVIFFFFFLEFIYCKTFTKTRSVIVRISNLNNNKIQMFIFSLDDLISEYKYDSQGVSVLTK